MGSGEGEDAARRLLAAFSELAAIGYPLKGSDVATAIRVLKENPATSLVEFFTESPFGPSLRSVVSARNNKQRLYVQTIDRHDLVFAIGPAGTGKTYLAVAMAAAAPVAIVGQPQDNRSDDRKRDRGVRLAAGAHRVLFEYHPPGLKEGAGLFVAGMLGLALFAIRVRPVPDE